MTVVVVYPTSSQAALIERAARLRCMHAALVHELAAIPPDTCWTPAQMSAQGRAERYELEAGELERAAGVTHAP